MTKNIIAYGSKKQKKEKYHIALICYSLRTYSLELNVYEMKNAHTKKSRFITIKAVAYLKLCGLPRIKEIKFT